MGTLLSFFNTCSCPRKRDTASGRRKILNESEWYKQQQPLRIASKTVKISTEYIEKPTGDLLFTKLFEPRDSTKAKAMIFYCIGFSDHSDWLAHDICAEFAALGFVVFIVDWKGHGRSDGIIADIVDFDAEIVDEGLWCFNYAIERHIKSNKTYSRRIAKHNNYFLMGSSMGGAIATKIALKCDKMSDDKWKGVVLLAPMIEVKEEAKPSPLAIWLLIHVLLPLCPKAKIIPNGANVELLSRDKEVQEMRAMDPIFYDQPIAICTGYNLYKTTLALQEQMHEFKTPLLICHGDDDRVTDCEASKVFYEHCACKDTEKMIKIYEGRGHCLYEEKASFVEDSVVWMEHMMKKLP